MKPVSSKQRAPWEASVTGVVSLLEMLDYAAADFFVISASLVQVTAFAGKAINFPGNYEHLLDALGRLEIHATNLKMELTQKQVMEIRNYLTRGAAKNAKLADKLEELSKRVAHELETRKFFYLPLDKVAFFDGTWRTSSNLERGALFVVLDEFDRAGRCFAFGENTACVFHLMRIVEWAIRQVARTLDPPPSAITLDALGKAIATRMEQKYQDKTQEWKEREPFYAQILNDIQALTRGYRNDTDHNLERIYDEREARHLLTVVEDFSLQVIQHVH